MTSPTSKRVCLLTGAQGHLGTAFCKAFAQRYSIVAVHRRAPFLFPSQHERLVDPLDPKAQLAENEHPVFAIRADLAEPGQIARIVELTLARFGRIDVVVNAAAKIEVGSLLASDRLIEGAPSQWFINVVVPLQLSVHVMREFWRDRVDENRKNNRNIINISSTSGMHAYANQGVYGPSKAALNSLTAHMGREFECIGVRANALAPGSFSTIGTDRVAAAIAEVDDSTLTGKIAVLDKRGLRFLAFGESAG